MKLPMTRHNMQLPVSLLPVSLLLLFTSCLFTSCVVNFPWKPLHVIDHSWYNDLTYFRYINVFDCIFQRSEESWDERTWDFVQCLQTHSFSKFKHSEGRRKCWFNDALNTFYLRLYGVRHMVKDHSESESGNLPQHGLLFPINSKSSFICIIPQTGLHIPRPLLHQLWSTG